MQFLDSWENYYQCRPTLTVEIVASFKLLTEYIKVNHRCNAESWSTRFVPKTENELSLIFTQSTNGIESLHRWGSERLVLILPSNDRRILNIESKIDLYANIVEVTWQLLEDT